MLGAQAQIRSAQCWRNVRHKVSKTTLQFNAASTVANFISLRTSVFLIWISITMLQNYACKLQKTRGDKVWGGLTNLGKLEVTNFGGHVNLGKLELTNFENQNSEERLRL